MGLFPGTGRQALKPHAHAADELCPWCEQPIPHGKFEDIQRRMAAEQDERIAALTAQHEQEKAVADRKAKMAIEQLRIEALAVAEQKVVAAKAEAARTAEAAMLAKLAEIQSRLVQAEQAKATAHEQMAALKEAQETAVEQRVQERQTALQQEKDAAVLAERGKVLKLQSELADMQRKLEGKSAHELGEGSEVDLFEQLKATFEGDRIWRVGKGVNGADVIHEVVHNGKVCGKIIYDAKNRNAWQNEFVNKLRADKIAEGGGPRHPLQQQVPQGQEPHPPAGRRDRRQSRARAGADRDPARPDPAHARAARQRRGARAEDGGALRLHHLASTSSSCWPRSRRSPARCWSSTARSRRRTAACGTRAPSSSAPCRRRAATSASRSTASSAPPATDRRRTRREAVILGLVPGIQRAAGSLRGFPAQRLCAELV